MPRVHYTAIAHRSRHIEATFAGFALEEHDWNARFRVRSRDFAGTGSGAVEVTVFARNVRDVKLTHSASVTGWAFHETHPLLLPYEPSVLLYCNDSLDLERLWGLVASIETVTGRWFSPWAYLTHGGLPRLREVAARPSFCVGNLPVSVARQVRRYLEGLGVSVFADEPDPKPEKSPKLLLLEDTDYLIADDFELDVPEAVLRPESVKP